MDGIFYFPFFGADPTTGRDFAALAEEEDLAAAMDDRTGGVGPLDSTTVDGGGCDWAVTLPMLLIPLRISAEKAI